MKHKIKVYSYMSDGGDGGGNVSVYGSLEELKADCFDHFDSDEERDEAFQAALDGESMYDYGEIDEDTLELEEVDGKLKLVNSLFFHWGQ
jgi:hypothetical protein